MIPVTRHDTGKTIWLNAEHIITIFPSYVDDITMIRVNHPSFDPLRVAESAEHIVMMIEEKTSGGVNK